MEKFQRHAMITLASSSNNPLFFKWMEAISCYFFSSVFIKSPMRRMAAPAWRSFSSMRS